MGGRRNVERLRSVFQEALRICIDQCGPRLEEVHFWRPWRSRLCDRNTQKALLRLQQQATKTVRVADAVTLQPAAIVAGWMAGYVEVGGPKKLAMREILFPDVWAGKTRPEATGYKSQTVSLSDWHMPDQDQRLTSMLTGGVVAFVVDVVAYASKSQESMR